MLWPYLAACLEPRVVSPLCSGLYCSGAGGGSIAMKTNVSLTMGWQANLPPMLVLVLSEHPKFALSLSLPEYPAMCGDREPLLPCGLAEPLLDSTALVYTKSLTGGASVAAWLLTSSMLVVIHFVLFCIYIWILYHCSLLNFAFNFWKKNLLNYLCVFLWSVSLFLTTDLSSYEQKAVRGIGTTMVQVREKWVKFCFSFVHPKYVFKLFDSFTDLTDTVLPVIIILVKVISYKFKSLKKGSSCTCIRTNKGQQANTWRPLDWQKCEAKFDFLITV